ncbi:hypothetical protein ACJW31_06G229400 [Castanea mollissima]
MNKTGINIENTLIIRVGSQKETGKKEKCSINFKKVTRKNSQPTEFSSPFYNILKPSSLFENSQATVATTNGGGDFFSFYLSNPDPNVSIDSLKAETTYTHGGGFLLFYYKPVTLELEFTSLSLFENFKP